MKKIVLGFIFTLLFSTGVYAEEFYGMVSSFDVPMGLNVGLSVNGGSCTGDCGDSFKPGGGIGINIGYRFSMSLGVYVEGLANLVEPDNKALAENYDTTFVQGNIGVNFYIDPTSQFQPFVTAGFGNFHIAVNSKEDSDVEMESTDQQTIFFGAGMEYVLSENFTLPIKLQFAKVFTEDGEETYKDMLWNFTLGVNYYF
ncbi:outer membrane beta-barrel protein [bacterium]|nr:outer membrane beta-barrel protein [bacterium]